MGDIQKSVKENGVSGCVRKRRGREGERERERERERGFLLKYSTLAHS